MRRFTFALLLVVLVTALPQAVWADKADANDPKAAERAGCNCMVCRAKERTREVAPWLELSADLRVREVFTPNLLLDEEDRHFQRYRARLGATIKPCEDLDFNLRLVYEPRHFCQPARRLRGRNEYYIDEWCYSEAIFDRMNVTWRKPGGLPLRAVIGRQDIILGGGWLVLDGTPLDDSRTIHFDAIRLTWDLEACDTTLETIYIHQYADSDHYITPFCDEDFHNREQDEQGVIIYATNKSIERTELSGYFIYKHDNAELGTLPGDAVAPWQAGADADIYTLGARAVHDLNDNINLMGEFAVQFGNKNSQDICAGALNTLATYKFLDKYKTEVHTGYEFLSGDTPGSPGTTEQFDPLWGRWARFSELLAYTHGLENRPGEATNYHRFNVGGSFVPCEKITLGLDYHLLFADQNSYPGRGLFGSDFKYRGQLWAARMIYQYNQHISGHLLAELFCPGDFYDNDRNNTAGFFRYELVFTW